MSQNVITNAAREGGRVASLHRTTSTEAIISRVEESLEKGGIAPELATIKVSPDDMDGIARGEQVQITVTVPLSDLPWLQFIPLQKSNLSSEIKYRRE